MKRFFTAIVPTAITLLVGWFVLATYFAPYLAPDLAPLFVFLREALVKIAIIVAASAMLLGILNLLSFHGSQILRRRPKWPDWFYSFVLILSFFGVFVLPSVFDLLLKGAPLNQLPRVAISGEGITLVYRYILIPIQASLAALLVFILAFAAFRTLRQRTPSGVLGALVFLVTASVVLLGQVPLFNLTVLQTAREWIIRVWAMGGMRGILLGVALGITATALRVLILADRPASD